jgi:hypothetical protein
MSQDLNPAVIVALDASVRSYDANGRLHISKTHITKATVNPYFGMEIPNSAALGLDPKTIYYLLRSPEELAKAAPTFERIQILIKHKPILNTDPPKMITVGTTGSDVSFEAPYLDADVCLWDETAIAGIETKTQHEWSCAYRYVAVMTSGIFEGQRYDGIMTDIQADHLAIVEDGRAGSDVIAADEEINPLALDGFNESDHPRATNGEFGSAGGGATGPVSVKVESKRHPFVDTFMREHTTIAGQEKHLQSVPTEKLHTALKLIEKSGAIEAGSTHVKKLIERELISRTRSVIAADEDIKTMPKTTKLGTALLATLGGMSAKLALDSALPALVGQAVKKTFNKADVSAKLIAMDADLKPAAITAVFDSLLALDEEKKEVAEDDDEHPKDCDCKECKKVAQDAADDEEKKEKKLAEDADKKLEGAMDSFRKDLRAANEARLAVRPVVGDVIAQDSAEEIYGFALDHLKVDRAGVTGVPALKSLFTLAQSSRSTAPVAIAQDSAGAAARFPNASRFRQG